MNKMDLWKILATISVISGIVTIVICEIYLGMHILIEQDVFGFLIYAPFVIFLDCGVAALLVMK